MTTLLHTTEAIQTLVLTPLNVTKDENSMGQIDKDHLHSTSSVSAGLSPRGYREPETKHASQLITSTQNEWSLCLCP